MSLDIKVIKEKSPLTRVENDYLAMMPTGITRPAIAEFKHRTLATVNSHFNHIFQKLGAINTAHAVAIAVAKGFLKIDNHLCFALVFMSAVNTVVPSDAYAAGDVTDSEDRSSAPFVRTRVRGGGRVRGGNQLRLRVAVRRKES